MTDQKQVNNLDTETESTRNCGTNNCAQNTCRKREHELSRKEFITYAIPGFAAVWSLMAAYPIYRYLEPKEGEGEAHTKVGSVNLGEANKIPKGSGQNFRFGSTPAIITHTEDGEFHAFKAVCTHLGCTVQFRQDKQDIWCACHGGCYDAGSGKNIAGPPPKPLDKLKVAIENGNLVVSEGA